MRILLVEDEAEMATALSSALRRYDMVVDHVPTLAEAEEAISADVHAAVLLDRHLPDGDGLALTILSGPAHGQAVVNDNGTSETFDDFITYTPASNFSGSDSLTYEGNSAPTRIFTSGNASGETSSSRACRVTRVYRPRRGERWSSTVAAFTLTTQ